MSECGHGRTDKQICPHCLGISSQTVCDIVIALDGAVMKPSPDTDSRLAWDVAMEKYPDTVRIDGPNTITRDRTIERDRFVSGAKWQFDRCKSEIERLTQIIHDNEWIERSEAAGVSIVTKEMQLQSKLDKYEKALREIAEYEKPLDGIVAFSMRQIAKEALK